MYIIVTDIITSGVKSSQYGQQKVQISCNIRFYPTRLFVKPVLTSVPQCP